MMKLIEQSSKNVINIEFLISVFNHQFSFLFNWRKSFFLLLQVEGSSCFDSLFSVCFFCRSSLISGRLRWPCENLSPRVKTSVPSECSNWREVCPKSNSDLARGFDCFFFWLWADISDFDGVLEFRCWQEFLTNIFDVRLNSLSQRSRLNNLQN